MKLGKVLKVLKHCMGTVFSIRSGSDAHGETAWMETQDGQTETQAGRERTCVQNTSTAVHCVMCIVYAVQVRPTSVPRLLPSSFRSDGLTTAYLPAATTMPSRPRQSAAAPLQTLHCMHMTVRTCRFCARPSRRHKRHSGWQVGHSWCFHSWLGDVCRCACVCVCGVAAVQGQIGCRR